MLRETAFHRIVDLLLGALQFAVSTQRGQIIRIGMPVKYRINHPRTGDSAHIAEHA